MKNCPKSHRWLLVGPSLKFMFNHSLNSFSQTYIIQANTIFLGYLDAGDIHDAQVI
jgi:hypothetical protein